MSNSVISSRDNDRVRHARKVREGQVPDEIFIEGVRLCEQAVQANLQITGVFHTEHVGFDDRGESLLAEVGKRFSDAIVVTDSVFASLSDTKSPQGIALLAGRPQADERTFVSAQSDTPLIVIAHRLNNPANAGAIVRAAEGAGATGLIATKGTADIFSAKALRGAMGSSFRLPIWIGAELPAAIAMCRSRGIRSICIDARATRAYTECDWTIACAVVVGPEAEGFDSEEIALSDGALRIPMREPVESLNAAVATGIVLYEARRQRINL